VATIPTALGGGELVVAVLQMLEAIQGWRAGSSQRYRLSFESEAQGVGARNTSNFWKRDDRAGL
jgi:hypothetical protein